MSMTFWNRRIEEQFFKDVLKIVPPNSFIRIANQEETDIAKAEKFLSLIHP